MPERLSKLYTALYGAVPDEICPIGAHASERRIFRLRGAQGTVCGVINSDVSENATFIYFAKHFRLHGLPVPVILAVSDDGLAYLEDDLGDDTLYDILLRNRTQNRPFAATTRALYEKALSYLPKFQVAAGASVDYSKCFQVSEFGVESMMNDMRSFLEQFLMKTGVSFEESALRDDFAAFAIYAASVDRGYFMYRDFQARNIMVRDDDLIFIDFQGGRRGPLHYDVVSLLYQSSARLSETERSYLLERYLEALREEAPSISTEQFLKETDRFIVLRMLQVLGTYGKQGLEHGKAYFSKSIPPAIETLTTVGEREPKIQQLTELRKVIDKLREHEQFGIKAPR